MIDRLNQDCRQNTRQAAQEPAERIRTRQTTISAPNDDGHQEAAITLSVRFSKVAVFSLSMDRVFA